MKPEVFVVIPTIRSLDFLEEWGGEFLNCTLILVEDHKTRELSDPVGKFKKIHHYSWEDILRDFGEEEWIFSRKNAGIRSYGFWKAYQLGADAIVTLDDDCYPVDRGFIGLHLKNLDTMAPSGWFPTFPHPDFCFTRGFPYSVRGKYETVISHGLWSNKIDLDGKTQLKNPDINLASYPPLLQFIPKDSYFPMCSMNLAFKRVATPLMYFPLMGFDPEGNNWGFDRFDDIWAGIFAKKICDHLGLSVINGSPFVEHRKASDPKINRDKEKTGIVINETIWKAVAAVSLTQKTPALCYLELACQVNLPSDKYFFKLRQAMQIWARLFGKK
jgi:reversibly glycosylated polypeptide/UDP-arabinopyranose mutase